MDFLELRLPGICAGRSTQPLSLAGRPSWDRSASAESSLSADLIRLKTARCFFDSQQPIGSQPVIQSGFAAGWEMKSKLGTTPKDIGRAHSPLVRHQIFNLCCIQTR